MEIQKISATAQKFNGVTYYLCGKTYQTKFVYPQGSNHFCGPNCKAAFRRRRIRDEGQIG